MSVASKLVWLPYCFLSALIVMPVGNGGIGFSDVWLLVAPLCVLISPPRSLFWVHYFALFYVVIALASILAVSPSERSDSFFRWLRLVGIFFPFFMATSFSFDRQSARSLMKWLWLGVSFSVVIAIFMYVNDLELMKSEQKIWVDGEPMNRLSGMTGNTAVFGLSLALLLVLSVYLKMAGAINYLWFSVSIPLILASIIISSSRTAAMCSVVGLMTYLIYSNSLKVRGLVALLVAVLIGLPLLALAMSFFDSGLVEESVDRFVFSKSTNAVDFSSGRLASWIAIVNNFEEYLLLGVGYKNGLSAHGAYIDNAYLSAFYELGLVAFLLLISFIFSLYKKLSSIGIGSRPERGLGVSVLSILVLGGMTADVYGLWAITPSIFCVFGVLLSLERKEFA